MTPCQLEIARIPLTLSIVMPVFNEEYTISGTITSCVEKIGSRFEEFEIVVVDDASDDNSPRQLRNLASSIPELRVLTNKTNCGHGQSLQRALNDIVGDLVFVLDSDFQHDPEDFWELFKLSDAETIVTGVRSNRSDDWFRRMASSLGNRWVRSGRRMAAKDINIPFKLFPGEQLRNLLATLPQPALVPSALLIVGAIHYGIEVIQVEVQHLPRRYGATTLTNRRFLVFGFRAALELFRYRRQLRNQTQRAVPSDRRT